MPETSHTQAIASRDAARAAAWKEEQGLDSSVRTYGSYEELLSDDGIDAVYMPLPTTAHLKWVTKAAAAGKHVLVEKPVAVNAAEFKEMMEACSKAGVVLMDGVMFMHHERLGRMRSAMDEAAVGPARRVVSGFSFPASADFLSENIRVKASCDPLGCVGDLGWYNVRFALWAFGYENPESVAATVTRWADGGRVPTEAAVTLTFSGGRHSVFSCGFHTAFTQWAEVAAAAGTLRLEDFVVARSADSVEFTIAGAGGLADNDSRVVDSGARRIEVTGCQQEAAMFDTFALCVASGSASDEAAFWPKVALQTQKIMDVIMQSARDGGKPVPFSE